MQKMKPRFQEQGWRMAVTFLCLVLLSMLQPAQSLLAAHGESLDGELKYPKDFKHFDYVSPNAKQGGTLNLHSLGGFDKMNPFTLKGESPEGLGTYVYETLTVSSLDEPFAQYGLIAKDIAMAPDQKSVTFTLNPKARFADGTPVRAEDVIFSLEILQSEEASPFYQLYFHDIERGEIIDVHTVKFHFKRKNRELHMIAGQLPVLSKKFFTEHGFNSTDAKDTLALPLGSGPYMVKSYDLGKHITYVKNPDYWAKDLPVRKGMFNFDTINIKYFKDQTVSLEAFKAGEFDFMYINIAKQWQRDLVGRKFDQGLLTKHAFAHKNNAGMQGFAFNTRRDLFKDRRVRQALGLALDFEWTNTTLFYSQYKRTNSYFANSELAATGLPSEDELKILEPFRKELPPEVFTQPLTPPTTAGPGGLRANLRKAMALLKESGYQIQDGTLVDSTGKPFTFEILLVSPTFERVMAGYVNNLQKLGVRASYRTIDPALYIDRIKNFNFDMTVQGFPQSQSPGNEQREFWGSSAAQRKGSRNVVGISDPVVDALIDAVIYAEDRKTLTVACRALDRVLWYGYYVVPNWYLDSHRLAFSTSLRYPETLPVYYSYDQFLNTWWQE
ncbi:extracellular solute-binding protein [Desulfogranum japonicum]|uniref:extracellular solute-binding protein n=1 Tax=Desulfogranum japonicum TaxID=231447 RepID=UPI0003F54D97|nr:extracellular solute-binding protein [Desulfogranum japonicum]